MPTYTIEIEADDYFRIQRLLLDEMQRVDAQAIRLATANKHIECEAMRAVWRRLDNYSASLRRQVQITALRDGSGGAA